METAIDIESLEQELVKLHDDLSQVAIENTKTKCTAWGLRWTENKETSEGSWRTGKRCKTFSKRRNCAGDVNTFVELRNSYRGANRQGIIRGVPPHRTFRPKLLTFSWMGYTR